MIQRRDFLKVTTAALAAAAVPRALWAAAPANAEFDGYARSLLEGFIRNARRTAPGYAVCDFEGGTLSAMAPRYDLKPMVSASGGRIEGAYAIKVAGTNRWRALFDLIPGDKVPIDLRCGLRLSDRLLSETWIYQYFP